MPLKAIIFDAYNTLFHNETPLWMETFGDICRDGGLPVSPEELWGRWKALEVGFRRDRTNMERPEESPPFKTYRTAWEEAFVGAFASLGIEGDARHASAMSVEGMARRAPYEDTLAFLEYAGRRWKLALLSNADNDFILPLLERHRLSFHAVVTSEMAQAYKPDPRAFLRVLREVGVSPEEALYVGDTLLDDVHGARLVGMKAGWLNRSADSGDPTLLAPDYEVSGLKELEEALESLEEVSSP